MNRFATALALVSLVALPPWRAAAAEDAPPPASAPPKAEARTEAAPDRAPRVRASHRVDVIAPGERVETVIDRLRAERLPAPPERAAHGGERLPVRGPDRQMDGGHEAPERRGERRDAPGPGAAGGHHSGAAPAPGTSPPGASPPASGSPHGSPGGGVPAPGTGGHRPDRSHR